MEFDLPEDQAREEYLAELIEQGALVLDGWSGDEPTFTIDEERMKEVAPEYWQAMVDDSNKQVEDLCISLFEQGMVELDIQDDGSIEFKPTDQGYQYLAEHAETAI